MATIPNPDDVDWNARKAWDRFVLDYVNAVDDDPGDARARYLELMKRIEDRQERP